MSDDKKKAKWNLSKNEKKKLSPLKGKDNVHVRLDKIQPQKGVRQTGINRAWRQEKELVEKTGRGTRNWTKKQLKELTTKGKVTGFKGHHIVNVKSNASLAGDPRNIVFVSKKEHELVHGKNFKNDTQGRGIDRKAMIKQHENNLAVRKPIGEKLAEAEARALQRVKLRPEQAQQLTQKVEDLGARLKPGLVKAKRLAKFAGIAEDVKEFWEADDKVMAGAKIIGKKVGARVGATIGGAVGAPFGGVGAPIGAAAGYIGGEYAGEYLAEKGVNLVRKVKNKVMQVIGEETQELAPENKPLELELVKKVVVYYSSDDEITLPVAFDDNLSDEDIPPLPKKNHLPKPAKPKQTKDELETDEDEEVVASLGQEDLEEIEVPEDGGVIVDQSLEEVGEELTQEDVDGVKAIFSEELERDLFDVAEFVTDNFLPDNDTKKVVQGALDCYAFARGYKDITDPMAVAGALVNYLPPELQKIASPVLKGVRAAKTMADMADKLQNGFDAIQLADVTDVLGLVAMIPGIPPEVSAVIGVISAAAKLASLLAAGTAPILPVALAIASLLLALHKMFDLFSGLGGGGGDDDGDGDGGGDGGGDGDDDGKDDADADDAQPDEGQPDPTAQPGDGNVPGNAPGYGQAPGQQPGDGQGEAAVQQPPQGPHHPNKPGQHPNKQDQKPNQQPQQQKDLQPPSSDQQPQEQELPNPPRNNQKPEQGQQQDRHVPPLNDQQPHQDQRQPQPKPQQPPRPESNTAEAKGEGQEEDKLKDDKNSREEEPFGEKKQRDLPHQSKEDMNQKRPSVELRAKDTSEISEKDEGNGMELDDNSISPSDEGDALTGSDEGSDDLEGEMGSEQGFEELEGKHGDFEEDFEDHTGEYPGSEEDLEGLFEGSELAPIDAAELDYTDLLTSDSKKSEQKSSRNKKKMASDQKGDGEDSVGEGSAEKDSQALSDFDGEEFDLEPFLTDGEKFKAKPNAKDVNKLEDSDFDDVNFGSDIGEFDDDARTGSEGSDVEGGSTTSQDTINASEDARMDIDNPTEFRNYAEDEVDDAADHSSDEAEDDDGDYESFFEDLENKLEEDFTEEQIAEARERLKEAKEGVSSNATVWAKIDAMCQFIEEVDYVSAILNDDTAFVAAQKQLLLAYTHYNAQRNEWLQRERVQRREAPRVKEVTEDDVEDAESEHSNELEDSLSEIIDADVNLLDESDLDELEDFDENDFSDDFDESFGDEEQGSGEDENPNLEHVGKIVGHRTMDDDPGKGKAIYRPSAPKLKHRKFNQDEEPEGVIFKENFDEHQHEFMKQVSDRAFYEVRQTETADKNGLSSTIVNKEKSFKQLVSGEVPTTLKSLLSEEHVQTLSSLTKGNAAFSQAVLELLSDEISAVKHIELLIKFWKPLAKLFVISDGIFPQQFLELQPFMNKLADVLASQEYQQFVKILPDLEALAEQTSALKFDLDMKSEEEGKNPIEKDNRDVVERILCKGMAASDEVATFNCLESPLDFQGIHYSDDISHILPIHALQLDNPDLEMMFWRDFTEKRLVTYEHDGGVIDDSNDDYAQMPRAKDTLNYLVNERAPFVVCLNTPIKMEKNEELAVKLLVLNVMRQCLIERRTAVVFGFTSKDLPNDVQKHVLKPDFDGLIQLIEICQATFDRSESFHEGYAWTTCEHAPLHSCALLLNEMEVKGRPLLAEVFITSLGITALSWPYSVLPSNGKLLVHLVEPNTTNYCSAVLENDTYTVLVEPKKISDLPVVAFIDGKSRYAQGVDHYRAEDSAGKDIHQLFWDGSETGESSSICLAFDHSTSFVFNANINLDQFATKGASPFINALTQQRTVTNVEKALASLTTFGNSDEISISSNVLVHHTSLVSLPTINYCCPLIHHVDIEELLTHPINSATIKEHMELWLKADAGVSKPEWHWQDQSTKQRDVNDITENDSQLPVLKHNEANQQRYIQFTANTHYAVNDLPELPVEVLIVNEKQSLPVTLSREVVPFNSLSVFPTAKVNSLNLQGEFINVYEIVVLRQGSPAECIDILTKYLKKKYNV